MPPQSKKQTQYLYSYSPSVHLACFSCCAPVLFCFSHFVVLHPKLPLQEQRALPFQLWMVVREEKQ